LLIRLPLTAPLLPYTTLFRSRLHGVPGDVEAPEKDAQRPQQREVDEISSARDVVELPERIVAGVVGPDEDETARRDREIRSGLRSEEHTSELQSHLNLVCRLL